MRISPTRMEVMNIFTQWYVELQEEEEDNDDGVVDEEEGGVVVINTDEKDVTVDGNEEKNIVEEAKVVVVINAYIKTIVKGDYEDSSDVKRGVSELAQDIRSKLKV